jgi:hypothetical protein
VLYVVGREHDKLGPPERTGHADGDQNAITAADQAVVKLRQHAHDDIGRGRVLLDRCRAYGAANARRSQERLRDSGRTPVPARGR